ncbi:MAG: rRNA adenine N-6-methyltransferase family protein, partial [Coriobacteriales bacterium]|nr:rRNA adenine N-6-methyltransferase family protein [Coriobacteriales bacterium]
MAYSYLANPKETRAVLERHGFSLKHRLGQNFLVNDDVIRRILELAELGPDDVVYEIGPGIGTLTVAMLPRVRRVVAVEADRSLPPVIANTCAR